MRVLAPLFEQHGVDFVLCGHKHNYQRPRPIRFTPSGAGNSAAIGDKDRRVACPLPSAAAFIVRS
jgi:acid phosphatase type 7